MCSARRRRAGDDGGDVAHVPAFLEHEDGDMAFARRFESATAPSNRRWRTSGALDIVVNNAGVMLLGPVDEAPLDEWQRMVSLNLGGLLNIAHAAIPHLLTAAGRRAAAGGGSSERELGGRPRRPLRRCRLRLTKFGVGGFSESARQEFARRHLRVAVLEPGVVRTELTDHIRDGIREAARERLATFEGLEPRTSPTAIAYIVTRPAACAERGGDSPDRAELVGLPRNQDSGLSARSSRSCDFVRLVLSWVLFPAGTYVENEFGLRKRRLSVHGSAGCLSASYVVHSGHAELRYGSDRGRRLIAPQPGPSPPDQDRASPDRSTSPSFGDSTSTRHPRWSARCSRSRMPAAARDRSDGPELHRFDGPLGAPQGSERAQTQDRRLVVVRPPLPALQGLHPHQGGRRHGVPSTVRWTYASAGRSGRRARVTVFKLWPRLDEPTSAHPS